MESSINGLLRSMRKEKGLTLMEMARLTGFSHTYISQLERGERGKDGIPSPDVLKKLASVLGVDFQYLMKAAGYLEEKTFGQKLTEAIREVWSDTHGNINVEQVANLVGIGTKDLTDILEDRVLPEPPLLLRLSEVLGNVSYSHLLKEAGYEHEALKESMREVWKDFESEHSYSQYDRARLLEEALDLKQLLEGNREDFQRGEVVPFYNGHLLTDSDRKRLAAIIKEVFPEYEEPGDDHKTYQTKWLTATDIE